MHQGRHGLGILSQPFETRQEQYAVTTFQLRQAGVTQPMLHAAQGIEQVSQLPGHTIAAGAQTQIADRALHAFRLQQRLARPLQDERFLLPTGATQQLDDAVRLGRRQRLAPRRAQHRRLVAHGQPHQLPR